MRDQGVELDEGAGVEQQLDPFAGGQFAAIVLAIDPFRAAAESSRGQALSEFFASVGDGRTSSILRASARPVDPSSYLDADGAEAARTASGKPADRRPGGGRVCENPAMPLFGLDTAALSRCLSQVAELEGDLADAYCELLEEVEIRPNGTPGLRLRREGGFSLRLVRGRQSWTAASDSFDAESLMRGLRRIARARPPAASGVPPFAAPRFEPDSLAPLRRFPAAVERSIRSRLAGFPLPLTVRRHRRWLQVVGCRLVSPVESEVYFSCSADLPWGRYGALLPALDSRAARSVAGELTAWFEARSAPPPESFEGAVVMAPGAVAVFLHEAVAHVLEADGLALTGHPEAAVGVQLGSRCLDILDDPGAAPEGIRRSIDDEGSQVQRRWLLRQGVVEQILGDCRTARESPLISPGAGRRADRHLPPVPRSTHLELLPGSCGDEELMAGVGDGLYVVKIAAGSLDPQSGRITLRFPFARRIRRGRLAEPVGACRLEGTAVDVLQAVVAVGERRLSSGAGWCAKGGQRMPVWATAPALRLESARIRGG